MATKLTQEEAREVECTTTRFLQSHSSITNRELREIAGINYDQAISFFNHMIHIGRLKRIGIGSGIRYVLP